MALRELLLVFGMDVNKNDENRVKGAIDRVKDAAAVLAGVWATIKSGEALIGIAMDTAELGDNINRTSQRIGIATDSLQELNFAAEQVSLSQEDLTGSFRVLAKQATAAGEGGKGAMEAFAKLGVKVKDTNGKLKSVDQLFKDVADGLVGIDEPAKRAALAQEVLGRSGGNLLPMLAGGSAGLADMAAQAHELGYVLDNETLKAAADMDDASDYLTAAMKGLKNTLGAQLLPTITEGVKLLGKFAKAAVPIVKTFGKVLIESFKVLSNFIKGFSHALEYLNKVFGIFGSVLGTVGIALTGLGIAFGVVGQAATIAGLKAAGAWLIATAPILITIALIGLIGAAIFLLIDEFVTMGEGGETVIGDLITYFTGMVDELGGVGNTIKEIFFNTFNAIFGMGRETFNGIIDGIMGLLSPVTLVVDLITNLFATLMNFVSDIFTNGISSAFTNLWDGIKTTAMAFVEDIKGVINAVIGPLKDVASLVGIGGGDDTTQAGGIEATGGAHVLNKKNIMPLDLANVQLGDNTGMYKSGMEPGKSIINQPTTNVTVQVDASGNPNPKAVGHAVGNSVDGVIERQNRQTLDAFSVSAS